MSPERPKCLSDPNPDLLVGEGDRPGWNQPDRRRRAFHNMHRVFRYSLGIRAPEVLRLGTPGSCRSWTAASATCRACGG